MTRWKFGENRRGIVIEGWGLAMKTPDQLECEPARRMHHLFRRIAKSVGMPTLALLSLALAGCAEVHEFENVGTARIRGEPVSSGERYVFDFRADQPLPVEVQLGFGDGCDEHFEGSCKVRVEGQTIIITARGSYETPASARDQACPQVAIWVEANCETPPLPAGTYVVSYGLHPDAELIIPSQGEAIEVK